MRIPLRSMRTPQLGVMPQNKKHMENRKYPREFLLAELKRVAKLLGHFEVPDTLEGGRFCFY